MGDPETTELPERFSLVAGGPFDALLDRVGLIAADGLPTRGAAIVLAAAAWLLPATLASAQALVDDRGAGWAFFTDFTVYARFLAATWAMIATERYADQRFVLLTRAFRDAKILTEDLPALREALVVADRRTASRLAEAVMLAIALALSGATTSYPVEIAGSSWEGTLADGGVVLSWAGNAARFVSNPLFLFLTLRWLWRFFVWGVLLHRISALRLHLTPLHPDGAAGLGFLAIYPSIFSGFVFALSCVISSSFLKDLDLQERAPETVWIAIGAWIAVCLAFFIGPLLVFVRPLYFARERAILEYGRLASQHHLAFDRKWMPRDGEELIGTTDPSSTSDLNASLETAFGMRVVPVDRIAVLQLVVSAGIPMLAVVARQVSLADLLKWIVGGIL